MTLAVAKPRDPANGDAEVSVGLADGEFWTNPSDGLPSFPFRAVFADGSGLRISEYLIRAGAIATGSSEIGRGTLTLESPTAAQDDWRDLDWNGAEITFYVGARYRADGQLMVFSEFDSFVGEIERMDTAGDRAWELSFADPRLALEEPATVKFYRGFGGGLYFPGHLVATADRYGVQYSGASGITLEAPFTLESIGRVRDLDAAALEAFTALAVHPAVLQVLFDGTLRAKLVTVSHGSITITTTHQVAEGEPYYLGLVVAADGVTVKLYAGTDADDVLEVWEETLPSAFASSSITQVNVGAANGNCPALEVWENRFWNTVKTQEELETLGDGPVTDATDRADLVESWRFSEGEEIGTGPAIVLGEKGVFDLSKVGTGDPMWVSSYEGDDPDQFPGSPAGQTKARSWGPAMNVKLVQIDSQRPAYTWHHVDDAADLDQVVARLRSGGVPMVRDHSLTSTENNQFVFDAATSTLTIAIPAFSPRDFRLFVAGQQDPARLGQRVVISNTASNNGTRRVAVNGISADGLTVKLTDGPVVDESALTGAKIESHPADVQYEGLEFGAAAYGLPPRVELDSAPDGDLTADLQVMEPGGFSFGLWSEIHAEISGKTVQTAAVSFDPLLAYHLPAGDAKTKRDVLDALARAAFGWWIENPNGTGHVLGNWLPPSGSPVASLGADGPLADVVPIRAALPVGKFEIAHSPIWHQQSGDSLNGSVSAGDRARWSEPYTVRPVVDRRIRDERFPRSREIPRIVSFVSTPSDVTSLEALARPFFFLEPQWFRLVFDSLWPMFIRPNDVLELTWDDPSMGLDATLVRVTGREFDTGAGTMALECFYLKSEPT